MPEKTRTEAKPRASVSELFEEAMSKPVSELYEQAMSNYEQALRTGLRMQEESGKWWTTMMDQASSPQDWQRWVRAMSDRFIPETQKTLEENMKFVEQNSRTGVELMKKAMEAAQSTSVMEGQAKLLNFWGASLNAWRDNAHAATQANTKAIEMWVEFLRRNAEMAGSINGGKAAKD
jgi:hypothetical protein